MQHELRFPRQFLSADNHTNGNLPQAEVPLDARLLEQADARSKNNDASGALALLQKATDIDAAPAAIQTAYHTSLAWANFRVASNSTPEGVEAFSRAIAAAEKAGDDPAATACLVSVLAQSENHRDDQRLFALANSVDFTQHPAILNGLIIRASKGGLDEVLLEKLEVLVNSIEQNPESFSSPKAVFGHIYQNFGKLALNVTKDPLHALDRLEKSLLFYDPASKDSFPHIGAAYFWIGQAYKALGNPLAQHAAELASLSFKMLAGGDAYANDAKVLQSQESIVNLRAEIAPK